MLSLCFSFSFPLEWPTWTLSWVTPSPLVRGICCHHRRHWNWVGPAAAITPPEPQRAAFHILNWSRAEFWKMYRQWWSCSDFITRLSFFHTLMEDRILNGLLSSPPHAIHNTCLLPGIQSNSVQGWRDIADAVKRMKLWKNCLRLAWPNQASA